jgi:osmotically-inducible protein OsmY
MITKSLDLQKELMEALAFDPRVNANDVAVAADDGIVTLRGTVPTYNQKWEAEDLVKRVRGVRGIANELAVDLPAMHVRSDVDIAQAIGHRFASNPVIPGAVKFVVKDGHVTLSGEVAWQYEAQEAAAEARRVAGVRDVLNLAEVHPIATVTPQDVKQKIEAALARDAALDARKIDVAIVHDRVTLSGSVHTWFERDTAGEAAWSLAGVAQVDNLIKVDPLSLNS